MKIYGDMISPFVRMTLVTAHETGLSGRVEHVTEGVRPTEVNSKLAALSAIGKIPILETDHGHAVYDSRVIIEYLCHVAGNSALIPDDGVKRFRVLTLQALAQGNNAWIGRLTMDAGAKVPLHRDPTEEYVFVIAGSGQVTIDGRTSPVAPGTTIFMPANAEVTFQNGDDPMTVIQVFAGPGPAAKYDAWQPETKPAP